VSAKAAQATRCLKKQAMAETIVHDEQVLVSERCEAAPGERRGAKFLASANREGGAWPFLSVPAAIAHSAFSLKTETRSARVGTVALLDRYAGDLIAEHCAALTAEMLHVQRFVFVVGLDQEKRHRTMTAPTKRQIGRTLARHWV
jgi:hypothetical protein